MKNIKLHVEAFLVRKEFRFFSKIENALRVIFSCYFEQITYIELKKKKLYIGIAVPRLVWHFNSLKSKVFRQIYDEIPHAIDEVIFLFRSRNKDEKISISNSSSSKDLVSIKKNEFIPVKNFNSLSDMIDVYGTIEKICYKKEYHNLLYKLYCRRVFKR